MWWMLLIAAGAVEPKPSERPGPRDEVMLPMSDGTKLFTRVMLPKGEGPWPTVLFRCPYAMAPILNQRCAGLNKRGYACVWQTVRGRLRSEGEWVPFENENSDGKDTLTWLVEQPFQDGNIAMLGESYLGAVQWVLGDVFPPEVKTFAPTVIGTDVYGIAYENGAFRHELLTAWMTVMPGREGGLGHGGWYKKAIRSWPKRELDMIAAKREVSWYRDWVDSWRSTDSYWQHDYVRVAEGLPSRIDVPVLMIGGWSDAFLGQQIDSWNELATKDKSTLVIGPWNHLGFAAGDIKLKNINDDIGTGKSILQLSRTYDWLNHHLKGEPAKHQVGKVVTYVVGADRWEVRDQFPPPTTAREFRPGAGDAMACEGALGTTSTEGDVQWTYDPLDPTPSIGGAGMLADVLPGWPGAKIGFQNQKKLCEQRSDMLGWVSEPLSEPLHIAGEIDATVRFASTAEDTAVNIRVVDIQPSGKRIHVREGIQVLSFREGSDQVAEYTPGDVIDVEVSTWPIEYQFQAGSRILFEVASASFPKFAAHGNVAEPWASVTEPITAKQTVQLEGTVMRLPVVK